MPHIYGGGSTVDGARLTTKAATIRKINIFWGLFQALGSAHWQNNADYLMLIPNFCQTCQKSLACFFPSMNPVTSSAFEPDHVTNQWKKYKLKLCSFGVKRVSFTCLCQTKKSHFEELVKRHVQKIRHNLHLEFLFLNDFCIIQTLHWQLLGKI